MSTFPELILSRIGGQHLLVPLAAVEGVTPALRPSVAPGEGQPPQVELKGRPLPVWFGAALLGSPKVVLEPSDQLLVLRGSSRVVLWVSAVEEILQTQVHPGSADSAPWLGGVAHLEWRSVPVLDVEVFFKLIPPQETATHAGS